MAVFYASWNASWIVLIFVCIQVVMLPGVLFALLLTPAGVQAEGAIPWLPVVQASEKYSFVWEAVRSVPAGSM